MKPDTTQLFRQNVREREIGRRYNGLLHLAFTTLACLAAILFCLRQLDDVRAWEWLAVPVGFLIANFAEYFAHRGPMHHRVTGLGLIFRRHAGLHHGFFTRDQMAFESTRDFKAVLFPPLLIVFFFAGILLPIGLLLAWLTTANFAWLFAATGIGYYLNYELLHLAYHSPPHSRISKAPGIERLRRHHTAHHDAANMTRYNFNITYPIADKVMGTYLH